MVRNLVRKIQSSTDFGTEFLIVPGKVYLSFYFINNSEKYPENNLWDESKRLQKRLRKEENKSFE